VFGEMFLIVVSMFKFVLTCDNLLQHELSQAMTVGLMAVILKKLSTNGFQLNASNLIFLLK